MTERNRKEAGNMAINLYDKYETTFVMPRKDIFNKYELHSKYYSRLFKKNYLKHLPKSREAKIIDLGCGLGFFLNFLREEGYTNMQGIDISREAVEFCKSKNLPVIKADMTTYSFGKSDVVVMSDVIEHLEKDETLELLSNIRKSLNPEGIVIIKTMNMASIVGSHSRYIDFTHKTGFSEESLTQVLGIAGFTPEVYPFDIYVKVPILNSIARLISKGFSLSRKLIFLLYGRPSRIFTKNIYAIGRKAGD